MLASANKTTEDHIVEHLLQAPGATAKDLATQPWSKDFTLQTLYNHINTLQESGVIIKQKTQLFVSQEWLMRLQAALPGQTAFQLSAGESLRWVFTHLSHLDAFWKHVMFQIFNDTTGQPVFMAGPHAIWPYAPERADSEAMFYEYYNQTKRHTFYMVEGSTVFDASMARSLKSDYVHFSPPSKPKHLTAHYAVVGDIISVTKLPQTTESAITKIYQSDVSQAVFVQQLTALLNQNFRSVFTLEHNPKKAKKLRKSIAQDFYVPRHLVEEFELW